MRTISILDLEFCYGNFQVLRSVSLEIGEKESVAILGPNGAGKTTLIRCIMGIFKPKSGKIEVFGIEPYGEREKILSNVGYLPENAGVYPQLTLKQYLEFFTFIRRVEKPRERIEEILRLFNLEEFENKKLSTFSKGMVQKAKLAAVFLHSPKLIVLDEPTDGLDMQSKEKAIRYMRQLKEAGTVVLSSHDPYTVEGVCDRLVLINKGHVIYDGDVKNFKDGTNRKGIYTIELHSTADKERLNDMMQQIPVQYSLNNGEVILHTEDEKK